MSTATAAIPARWKKRCVSPFDLKRAAKRVEQEGVVMTFEATISTPAPDRDGDVLHPEGAEVDPQSPLLWQHDVKAPIGKLTAVTRQDPEALAGRFIIADTELGRDAAKLVELGCLRISHGFSPQQYEPLRDEKGNLTGGYDIARYSVLEVSLVSVPSNVNAIVTAYTRGELKSAPVVTWAKSFTGERLTPLWRRAAELGGREPKSQNEVNQIIATALAYDLLSAAEYRELTKQEAKNRAPTSQQTAASGRECVTGQCGEPETDDERIIRLSVEREFKLWEKENMTATNQRTNRPDPNEVIANAPHAGAFNGSGPANTASGDAVRIRVKDVSEAFYSTKRKTCEFTKHGTIARGFGGEPVEEPSQWDKAMLGCYLQFLARKAGIGSVEWTEHHEQIMAEMIHREKWNGMIGGQYEEAIAPHRVKTLLDDVTSGGSVANPYVLDMMVVQPALLSGELMPHVTLTQIPRGSDVHAFSLGIPTVQWDTSEGTAADLFDTADLIGQIESKITAVAQFIECGVDTLSDIPLNIGSMLGESLGTRLQAELDRVIATGNGTNEPLGIVNTGTITSAPTAATSATALSVGDAESLIFTLDKPYRVASARPRFLGSDVMYRKFRQIPTGTGFNTRAFDFSLQNSQAYTVFEFPYSVQNDVSLGTIAFCAMRYYRLYRRLGLEMKWTTEGRSLTLSNTALLSCRARFGGQLMLGAAASIMTGVAIHDED